MASYFEETDLAAMLEDCPDAVDVVLGDDSTKGIRDITDPQILTGEGTIARGKVRVVAVKTGTLSGLTQGASITIEGEAFIVRDFEQVEDGAVTEIRVRVAP